MDKSELRRLKIRERRAMPPDEKKERSQSIAEQVFALDDYKRCDTLLCFVSTQIEVDTSAIIERAFADGKKVAAPRCEDKNGHMNFYYIESTDDLETAAFGIFEPKKHCRKAGRFERALCVVPALTFTETGYRLGFGKGYYDRFLSGFSGVSCGVIFDSDLTDELPTDRFDCPVMIVACETRTIFTDKYAPVGKGKET